MQWSINFSKEKSKNLRSIGFRQIKNNNNLETANFAQSVFSNIIKL